MITALPTDLPMPRLLAPTLPACLLSAALSFAALPAYADLDTDVLACEVVDFQACPALLKLAATRGTAAVPALGKVLADSQQPIAQRLRAATALAMLDGREQLPAFKAAAASLQGKPELIDILVNQSRLGDVSVAPVLIGLTKGDQTPRTRTLAAGALGLLHHKPAVPALLELLKTDDQPRVQAEAAHALGLLGDSTAVPALLAMACLPKLYVPARVSAIDALAALHSPLAVVLATQLIDAPTRDIGRAALRVLQAAPTPWAAPAVLFALDTPGLRGEAARAAVAMRLTAAHQKLIDAAVRDDLDAQERVWLLHALGKLQPAGAGPALMKRLQTATSEEKVQILHALPSVADKTVVPDLVTLLQTTQAQEPAEARALANHVIFALENLTGQNLGPDVKAWRVFAGMTKADPPARPGKMVAPPSNTLKPGK